MKRIFLILCVAIMVMSGAGIACANVYNFDAPALLHSLDHSYCYQWGIDWEIPENEYIVGASLFFDDLRNWDNSPNVLYVNLLDTAASIVMKGVDNPADGDIFEGLGTKLFEWHNFTTTPQDMTHIFEADELDALTAYLADGNFGFGLDPDCHYWTTGVTFTVETAYIPIPSTMFLLGSGFVGLMGLRKKWFTG